MTDIPENDELSRTDDLARASEIAMRDTAEAIATRRAMVAPERIPDGEGGFIYQVEQPDGTYPIPDCVDCGEPNIELRLEMGRIRCVPCQELREQKR